MWKALLFSIFMPSSFYSFEFFLFFRVLFIEILSDESLQFNSSYPASCADSLSFPSEKILHEHSAFFFQYT